MSGRSLTNLQDQPITVGAPVEIERATNVLRNGLSSLPWLTHPYHIAHRFVRIKDKKKFYYPETYVGGGNGIYNYHRLTPDNDYIGMCFFLVGDEKPLDTEKQSYLEYPVSIIFSCNLKRIDNVRLENDKFTQELIRDVRQLLVRNLPYYNFRYTIDEVSRDLRRVYREFVLDEVEQYNRLPMQVFRFDLTVTIESDCDEITDPHECCGDCFWTLEEF